MFRLFCCIMHYIKSSKNKFEIENGEALNEVNPKFEI